MLSIPHDSRHASGDEAAVALSGRAMAANGALSAASRIESQPSAAAETGALATFQGGWRVYSPEELAVLETAVACAASAVDAAAAAPRTRRIRRRSKNCHTLSKFGPAHENFRRVASLTPSLNQTQRRREALSRRELWRVRQQVLALERRQLLLRSLQLARQANAAQLVADKVCRYYRSFSRGYDPTRSDATAIEALLQGIMLPDVESPAFRDRATFLALWRDYSRYHAEISLSCEQIHPLDCDDPDVYLVQCAGRSTLRISRDTIKHFFQPLLADEEMVQRLVGKTYVFPYVSRFYFDSSGRVFRMEPRADLAAGLFDLVVDPLSTVRMLGASKLSDDGCLHAYSESSGRLPAAGASETEL
ncbi:hypothetical protein BBJ28_00007396 [Nothophytophthora sp. Chile5]|nr:hypothetical protein BBJ28_00007396 [Nothophytophthora sp. Chile5]